MTDQIRVAANALLDACEEDKRYGRLTCRMQDLSEALRAALSAPQPAADERVAELMRAVMQYGSHCRGDGIELAQGGDSVTSSAKCARSLAAAQASARALLAAGREDAETIKPERVRHVVSGRLYNLIGDATVQSDSPLTDMTQVRLYRGNDGKYWVRPIREFSARFVAAEPGPVEPSPAVTDPLPPAPAHRT